MSWRISTQSALLEVDRIGVKQLLAGFLLGCPIAQNLEEALADTSSGAKGHHLAQSPEPPSIYADAIARRWPGHNPDRYETAITTRL